MSTHFIAGMPASLINWSCQSDVEMSRYVLTGRCNGLAIMKKKELQNIGVCVILGSGTSGIRDHI